MTGVKPNLGHGFYLSAALHGGLVLALVFLAAPRPFAEAAPDAVEVEVLTEKEAAEETKKEVAEPKKELAAQNGKQEPSPPPRPAEAKPELGPSQNTQTAAATPTPAPGAALPAAAPPPEPAPPQGTFSAFNPAGMAEYFNLRPPVVDFNAVATEAAKLSSQEVAAFRAHLRRCWRQPEGVSPSSKARVLLRVTFAPDGALAAEPALIEASASRDGPPVYKAALQALAQCQPHRTLPRERYREWKVLDVTFSAQEMAGG